ncbi:MAG: flagellar hook protein FlgE [Terracidiphilus sp.]
MSSYSIALSGLAASSEDLSVISNNLANLNTDGYKDETLDFASVFNNVQGTSGNGDPIQTGNGVEVAGREANFSDGNYSSTGIDSNMAIDGNGLFVVQDSSGTYYTRDGDFTVNSSGELCTSSGQLVMGYPATDGVVSTSSALSAINVNNVGEMPASATTTFQTTTNLDSSASVGDTFSTSVTTYDSLGASHALTVTYTKTDTNDWSYSVTIPSEDVGGTSGTTTEVAAGTMTFDSSGNLTSPTGTVTGISITGLADGASDMSLTWNLDGSGTSPIITQEDSSSTTSAQSQNGYAAGTLTGYTVNSDGTVEGKFSNDQTQDLGQVAIASFANQEGLSQVGSNGDYQATAASGQAVIGVAGSGNNGTINDGEVEESNVNLSTEFANMIVAQQSYEASAKVLTTLDQVSQATLQAIT